jgi:hypothetical protein
VDSSMEIGARERVGADLLAGDPLLAELTIAPTGQ